MLCALIDRESWTLLRIPLRDGDLDVISTGEFGVQLCNALARTGFEVFSFKGGGAMHPDAGGQCHLRLLDTNDGLLELLTQTRADHEVAAVFHSAALCDCRVKHVEDDQRRGCQAAMIASRSGTLTIDLEPATKVTGKRRQLFPKSILVGWKYELDGTWNSALTKAARPIEENRTEACILNGRAFGPGFAFCRTAIHPTNSVTKADLCIFCRSGFRSGFADALAVGAKAESSSIAFNFWFM